MARLRATQSFVEEWRSMWEPDLEAIAFNGATCDPTRVDPKVLEWAKHNCSHKPHFIKVINSNASNVRSHLTSRKHNCKLTVPRAFVKEHFRELERVVTLQNDEGRTWKVSFGAARFNPSWQQGWRRVADDNDLQPGQVLVFVLVAKSRFHLTHFDDDGNILSLERSTNSTLNDVPLDHSSEAECGAQPSGLGFDGHAAPSQLLACKQIAEAPCQRRMSKAGETMSTAKSNNEPHLAFQNDHPLVDDCEEAGSTSMADGPSTYLPSTTESHKWQFLKAN